MELIGEKKRRWTTVRTMKVAINTKVWIGSPVLRDSRYHGESRIVYMLRDDSAG